MFDLAVVDVRPAVLERVQHGFLRVVAIAAAAIGGIQIQTQFEGPDNWPDSLAVQDAGDLLAVQPAPAAEQHAGANMSPHVIE
jgi:hypothetical protein